MNETVSLSGTTDGDNKGIGLLLIPGQKTWEKFEVGSYVFVTQKGRYVLGGEVNTVVLRDAANTKDIGVLRPLDPEHANAGERGTGNSTETGINFHWIVQ